MLFDLFQFLSSFYSIFNVFRYITFRTIGSVLTALVLSFILGPHVIRWLKKKQREGQPIREDGPQSHLVTKKGTPTMGGGLILLALTISTLLWANLRNPFVWILLLVTLGFGILGAMDDYLKLTKRTHHGLSGRKKIIGQLFLSLLATYLITLYTPQSLSTHLTFPFLKDLTLNLGLFFFVWSCFVIIGSSNAVNLTDGLDGLAIVPVILSCVCFTLICYVVGNKLFASYLQLHHIPNLGEVCIFLGSFIGAGLGFLWFNAPPARIFMGDTGSLSAGGALGVISVMSKNELVWAIIGGLFVIEAVSVILQVLFFKVTGRRIFLMAPIHHHFEKMGWAEPTIVIRFWIIAAVLSLLGLATLKIR